MAQPTLTDPIDGSELKAIILERIARALDRDSTLANDIAYAGFTLSFEIRVKYLRSTTAPTLVWGNQILTPLADGVVVEAGPEEVLTDTYATDSPNAAREAHDLPVPVMVQTPNGPQRRKVHVNARTAAK